MSPEVQARIFDPFFSTKVNGTGLGMAIARSVVHFHGGRLEVHSEIGRGTRVSVHLPVEGRAPGGRPVESRVESPVENI
jgi:signal transduction histidine kinase